MVAPPRRSRSRSRSRSSSSRVRPRRVVNVAGGRVFTKRVRFAGRGGGDRVDTGGARGFALSSKAQAAAERDDAAAISRGEENPNYSGVSESQLAQRGATTQTVALRQGGAQVVTQTPTQQPTRTPVTLSPTTISPEREAQVANVVSGIRRGAARVPVGRPEVATGTFTAPTQEVRTGIAEGNIRRVRVRDTDNRFVIGFRRAKEDLRKADEFVSERFTKKIIPDVKGLGEKAASGTRDFFATTNIIASLKTSRTPEQFEEKVTDFQRSQRRFNTRSFLVGTTRVGGGFLEGSITEIREKPVKNTALFVAGAAASSVVVPAAKLGASRALIAAAPSLKRSTTLGIIKAGRVAGTTARVGLEVAAGASLIATTARDPVEGGRLGANFAAFLGGGAFGVRTFTPVQKEALIAQTEVQALGNQDAFRVIQAQKPLVRELSGKTIQGKNLGKFDANRIQGLSKAQANRVNRIVADNRNVVIFGSQGQVITTQKGVGFLEPGTITRTPSGKLRGDPRVVKDLDAFIRGGATEVALGKATGGRIKLDIKSYDVKQQFPFSKKPVTVEVAGGGKTKVIDPGEQLARKFFGAQSLRVNDKTGVLEAYRAPKDIPDFISGAQSLIKSGVSPILKRPISPGKQQALSSQLDKVIAFKPSASPKTVSLDKTPAEFGFGGFARDVSSSFTRSSSSLIGSSAIIGRPSSSKVSVGKSVRVGSAKQPIQTSKISSVLPSPSPSIPFSKNPLTGGRQKDVSFRPSRVSRIRSPSRPGSPISPSPSVPSPSSPISPSPSSPIPSSIIVSPSPNSPSPSISSFISSPVSRVSISSFVTRPSSTVIFQSQLPGGGGGGLRLPGVSRRKRRTRFNPSIVAKELNVKIKKSKVKDLTITGVGVRPIPV